MIADIGSPERRIHPPMSAHLGGPAAYKSVSEIRLVNSDRVEEPDEGEQVAAGANRADPDGHDLGL